MKRKTLLVLLLICIVLALASCISVPYDKPYGVWHNETIGLTLDLDPKAEKQGPCYGVYIVGGEEIKVEIYFGHNKNFKIESVGDIVERMVKAGSEYVPIEAKENFVVYFGGDFKVKDGKLYYYLAVPYEGSTGTMDTIIFDLIEEYEEWP